MNLVAFCLLAVVREYATFIKLMSLTFCGI